MKRLASLHSNTVWPPVVLIALFGVFYGLMDVGLWLLQLALPSGATTLTELPEVRKIRAAILIVAAVIFALYRLGRFHPACNHSYTAWLRTTPWTADKPLPVGPIHPVWQDAVVIGVLAAIAQWHAHANPALPVVAFGFAYLIGMTLLLALVRQRRASLALGFLWPALLLPWAQGWPALGLLVALILVIWIGHHRSLRAFPWDSALISKPAGRAGRNSVLQMDIRLPGIESLPVTALSSKVGWPMSALSPKIECHATTTTASFFQSLMLGWWLYCIVVCLGIAPLPELLVGLGAAAAIARVIRYCSELAPPCNLRGRIVSGRLVIPGFDKVFLTPLAAVAVVIVGGMIVKRSGEWYPEAEAGTFALLWFVLLGGGPSLKNWMLTGHNRFRPPAKLNASKRTLQPV